MEELTGIRAFDWVLAALYAVAAALVVGSVFWRSSGARVRGLLAVPAVVGLAGMTVLAVVFADDTRTFFGAINDRAVALAAAALVLLVGAALADFLVSRGAPAVTSTRVFRSSGHEADAALGVVLLVSAVLGLLGIVKLDERTTSSHELSRETASGVLAVEAEYEPPGQPMDVSMRTPTEGYLSLEDGRIARLLLGDGSVEVTIVASGLDSPRGLAVVGNTLIVADIGPLPCEAPSPCKGENVEGATSKEEGERRILRESNGRLLRFDIGSDGGLANQRIILDGIPVANSEHAVNGVTAGPDGRVYVAVGNLDRLAAIPLTARERARPNFDWLGAVLSLRPDGSDVRVVARGLRNVYDLAFDADGRLYGVDNDGETSAGWRREEVLEIRKGEHYGHPFDGTFAPHTRRTAPPLWILDTAGSAGVEWLRANRKSTLVVGSCSDVYAVEFDEARGSVTVTTESAVRHLLSVPGCVTAVERVGEDLLLLALYTFDDQPRLYLARLER